MILAPLSHAGHYPGGKEECPWGLYPLAAGLLEATSQAAQVSAGGVLE